MAVEATLDLTPAMKQYVKIKEKYPKSSEASDIDKYIARVQK